MVASGCRLPRRPRSRRWRGPATRRRRARGRGCPSYGHYRKVEMRPDPQVRPSYRFPFPSERGDPDWPTGQRSSRVHRAASGSRSPACSARRATRDGGRAPARQARAGGGRAARGRLRRPPRRRRRWATRTTSSASSKRTASSFGRLDVLVNNAGVGIGGPSPSMQTKKTRHAARRQPALDRPLLPRVHRDAARRRGRAPQSAWSSTRPRSPARPARRGCRSTRPPRPRSSAGRRR